MYLKDRANRDGTCWPSIWTIAGELRLSRTTVFRALDDLYKAASRKRGPLAGKWREDFSLYKIL